MHCRTKHVFELNANTFLQELQIECFSLQVNFQALQDYFKWILKCKGHLISEQIYAVLDFPKMQWNIARISCLASKIRKVKALYHPKYWLFIIWYKKLPYFFDLTNFRSYGRNSGNISLIFWKMLRHYKFVLKLSDQ